MTSFEEGLSLAGGPYIKWVASNGWTRAACGDRDDLVQALLEIVHLDGAGQLAGRAVEAGRTVAAEARQLADAAAAVQTGAAGGRLARRAHVAGHVVHALRPAQQLIAAELLAVHDQPLQRAVEAGSGAAILQLRVRGMRVRQAADEERFVQIQLVQVALRFFIYFYFCRKRVGKE